MYLDKVEIHGFKSFGDAVKLSIPKGITGVIGPNGSGKSNVSDAIRWVLGEQSAKSLRGSKMEDIIFAGTEKRKSLGYAEVALTIKNPNKEVAIDYTEIIVKRRVYRSGESEYFINGSPCRLRDVQELFMDTGVGRDGYSIIGQGQIDRVLSSKPDERRTLFEEAAGIYKYKVRRIEAEKKLDKQKENLTRLQDIIGEIEDRIDPLGKEAEKTTQFLKLKETLKEVDINIFIHEIERLDEEITNLNHKITAIDEEIIDKGVKDNLLSKEYEALKNQRNELYQAVENLIQSISQIEQDKERKQGQIALNQEKLASTKRLLEQIYNEQKNQVADHQSKKEKLSILETKKTALELEKAAKESIISQDEEKINEVATKIEKIEGNIDHSKNILRERLREIDVFEANIQKDDGVEAQLDFRKDQIQSQVAQANSEIQHQEVSIKLLEKNRVQTHQKMEDLSQSLQELKKSRASKDQEKISAEKQLIEINQNVLQAERQLKWLHHIKEENEGFYNSVKQVLNIAKKSPKEWQGIVGVVGELLQVPKIYEIAIVTALGSAIQNIVTEHEQDAKAMIRIMKQKGISRVTFLPLDTMRAGYALNEPKLSSAPGYLGLASQLIGFDKKYESIITGLLGRIIIVDNMEHASHIAKTYQYKYKIVTLEGEVFNSGGSLSGGSMKNQTNNIFSRARELKETEEKVIVLKQKQQEFKDKINQLHQELEKVESSLAQAQEEWTTIVESDKNFILEIEKNQQALKLTKANQLQLINERNNIDESLEAINKSRQAAYQKLQALKEGLSDYEKEIIVLEEQLLDYRHEKETMEKVLTDKRISFSATIQNMNYMLEQIADLETAINSHDEKNVHFKETVASYEEEMQRLQRESESIKLQITQNERQIQDAYKDREDLEVQKKQIEVKEVEVNTATQALKEQIDLLKEEKYRLENKKESSLLQKQNWGNSMWEQYEMTFTHALSFRKENINLSEYKKQSVVLRSNIKQIGSVNVNAVEEFEAIKKRYTFLSTQKEDIEKAARSLEEMIAQLMEEMKEIFRVQFAIIAKNFTQVFKELFGGGEAYLELVDEENILESGIEIIAKPPGKKLQNMTLLSGGERTLTAISLIFGILKLKPSPFCVLDEIEAALDDANVIRFANYLEKLSSETQFIVITHRKGTMERAHTLYGVTMQERGVSTVLSIQLGDVDQYIDKKKTS